MSKSLIDDTRREDVCVWLRSFGLDPGEVPLEPGAITVEPIHEGGLLVRYREIARDANGKPFVDVFDLSLYTVGCEVVVDTPPPGKPRLRRGEPWDVWAYITNQEDHPGWEQQAAAALDAAYADVRAQLERREDS